MRVPSFFYHRPICLIAVHRDLHTSAAAGDAGMEVVIVQFCHVIFDILDIDQCARFRYITSVQQCMQANFLDTICLRTLHQRLEMVDV